MPPAQQNSSPDYDFILNSGNRPKRNLNINLGQSSFIKRMAIVVGGFILFIIVIIVFKNIFSSSSLNVTSFESVLQDQTEMMHILNNDIQNQNTNIDSANEAFAQTTLLSMTSYQSTLLGYLSKNGVSVSSSVLAGKQNSQIDNELTSALNADNLNSIFQSVMSQQLVTYNSDLTKAFQANNGPIGRQILQSQYKGTQLLIRALNVQYS